MQVEGRVREKADWLFKCVGEAYSVLTDSQARLELDAKLAHQERQERYNARSSPYKSSPMYRWRLSLYPGIILPLRRQCWSLKTHSSVSLQLGQQPVSVCALCSLDAGCPLSGDAREACVARTDGVNYPDPSCTAV